MIVRSEILVNLHQPVVRVPENSVRNRSRREIVIRESRLIRRRQELEESERRRRDPIGANDIQLAVAADLIAKVLGIAGTDVRSRVEVGVQPSGERVVDRDQIPGGIPPIGEVTVSFLRSGEGQWIDADTARGLCYGPRPFPNRSGTLVRRQDE